MTSAPLTPSAVRLYVIALETPPLIRHCRRCGPQSRFVGSDRFRLNAHQQRLDVWLIYRCSRCETTYNVPILSRCRRRDIGEALYQQFLRNDPETAWRYAFDAERLHRLHIPADFAVPYRVAFHPAAPRWDPTEPVTFTTELIWPCQVRLDRLLASALSLSRPQVQQWVKAGRLRILPERSQVWRKPAQSGQCIVMAPPVTWPLTETGVGSTKQHHTELASSPVLCLTGAPWQVR